MSNVKLNDGFTQVCIWPGTIVGRARKDEFEAYFKDEMDVRVQYLEDVYTAPDVEDGVAVAGTGGRCDALLAVHSEDVGKFAIPRLQMGIRWIEDVYGNGNAALYPERMVQYMSWQGYQEEYAAKVTA